MDGASSSGAGGPSGGASLRISKWDDIVLVDSAVGAAVLVCGAAMVVRVDFSIGADNVRTAVPGAEGDIEPLLADCCFKPVAAGKAPVGPNTPRASVSASAVRIGPPSFIFPAGENCWYHIGIALRNFKRRSFKLASVRRDIPCHDYGLDLGSSLTSNWVCLLYTSPSPRDS